MMCHFMYSNKLCTSRQDKLKLHGSLYTFDVLVCCLASVAGLEYAYANAPKSMRSLIMALYLSTVSVGTFLAMAVLPLTVDPMITWMYIILAMAVFGAGAALWSVPVQRKEAS